MFVIKLQQIASLTTLNAKIGDKFTFEFEIR